MATIKEANISQVIDALTKIMEEHGDIKVSSSPPGGYFASENIEIDIVDTGVYKFVSIEGD